MLGTGQGATVLSTGALGGNKDKGRRGPGAVAGGVESRTTCQRDEPSRTFPGTSFPSFSPTKAEPLRLGAEAEGWTHWPNQENGHRGGGRIPVYMLEKS